MLLPPLNVVNILLAAAPILLVLYLMVGRRWGGSKAGPAGWLAAVIIALLFFGADLQLILVAAGRAVLLALFVLYIIWMALFLYHVVNEAGAIGVIGERLPRLAPDRATQGLLLAWIFGSFLQGASGFGVPAAVVAPLLLGLGFGPNAAVAAALLGHGWAVTFGSLGSSFISLIAATGVPGELFAAESALLLWVACLACGLGVLWIAGGRQALRSRWAFLLLMTLVMGGTQYLLAVAGFWTLAAFGAGLAGLIVGVAVLRIRLSRRQATDGSSQNQLLDSRMIRAFFPYLILVVIIVLGQLVFAAQLDIFQINYTFPAVKTAFGWETGEGPGRSISVFGHAGALLLYAGVISYFWFRWRGSLQEEVPYSGKSIVQKSVRGSIKTTVSILTLVAMATTMGHAGMTQMLAEALSQTGPLFPLLSPFIGALGAFMTGSNTNSNVVFGELQKETALALNLSVAVILAAQTSGGAIGSIFAPAKVVVGCSTVKGAIEGQVLRTATLYGLAIIAVLGILTWIFA